MATPYEYVHLASATSTQDEARRRLGDLPVLVAADRQHKGRGRSGRRWWQAERAVFASLALRPSWPRQLWSLIPLAAGLAARSTLASEVGLKWPNDLMTAGGKVGGLLSEADGDSVIVGLGLNLWWPEPPDGASAIYDADPGEAASSTVAAGWAGTLLAILDGSPQSWGRAEYRSACVTLGSQITWTGGPAPGSGRAIDIADDGALIVATPSGEVRLHSGEVHLMGRLR